MFFWIITLYNEIFPNLFLDSEFLTFHINYTMIENCYTL